MRSQAVVLYVALAAALLGTFWLFPSPSLAHPLGHFSINHYTEIQLARDGITLHYVLDLAEIPTFQEMQRHGLTPEAHQAGNRTYLDSRADTLKNGLFLEVDGQPLTLQVVTSELLFPSGAGGLPTLKLEILYQAALETSARHAPYALQYRDSNFPGRAGWQEIIVTAGPGVQFLHSSVPATDRSKALTDYPVDMLQSPPQILAARVVFAPLALAATAAVGTTTASNGTPEVISQPVPAPPAALTLGANRTPRNAFTEIMTAPQLSLGMIGFALVIALSLGAFHALEPGHGKTVVAAYLVGTRGTVWHALYLGLIVTLTHTIGVYLLGVVLLCASHYVVPERLYPWLGGFSGVLIAGLGGYLFLRRYAGKDLTIAHAHAGRAHDHLHEHEHASVSVQEHQHSHHHAAAAHAYVHTAHHHTHHHHHHHELPDSVSVRELLTLGITGGVVPCPAALVVFLSAVALQRIGFGLLLIAAFSVGLAMVLIAIGLLTVYARRFMARFQGEGVLLNRWLPLTSAATITVLGMGMVIQALVAAGVMQLQL
jgi:ABC-type nickel/cobalt efflux system permease component RcnA